MNEESLNNFVDCIEDFAKYSFSDQIKYLSYYLISYEDLQEFKPADIKKCYSILDLKTPKNIPDFMSKLEKSNIIVRKTNGYTLERTVRSEIDKEYGKSPVVKIINDNLRLLLPKIKNPENKEFLKEAIDCLEIKAFRSAIIMTWLMVIHHLYEFIINKKLIEFNTELGKKGFKIKSISKIDDFGEIKESVFIELARAAIIISNDERKILDEKLGIRNTCAHPNNIIIKESKAINFIEDLIENIYLKFN